MSPPLARGIVRMPDIWPALGRGQMLYVGEAAANAEPDVSGSTSVQLSPGSNVEVGGGTHLYGFVQVPVYQHVNGVQLVPRWSVLVGANTLF